MGGPGREAPSGLNYPRKVGLTVIVLLVIAAAVLVCLGAGIGVVLSRRESRAAMSAADLAGLAGTDTAVPVLAALRSTVVVLDDDDEVLALRRLDDVSLPAPVQEHSPTAMQQQQHGVPVVRGGIVALQQGDPHRRIENLDIFGLEPEVDRSELWALPR